MKFKKYKNPNNKFYKFQELISLEITPVVCMSPPTELAWAMSGLQKQIPTSASNNQERKNPPGNILGGFLINVVLRNLDY